MIKKWAAAHTKTTPAKAVQANRGGNANQLRLFGAIMTQQTLSAKPTAPSNGDRGSGRRIPPYIYPDSEDRDRCITFTVTRYTRTEVLGVSLAVQVRHGGRYFLGSVEKNGDGWQVVRVTRNSVEDGVIHESVEAAAIACHGLYQEQKRAARVTANRD